MRGLVIQYLLDGSDADFARSKKILLSHLERLQ
jgi:hypothetical protein